VEQQVLGQHLVHRAHAGEWGGAGVGDAEDLEQLLDSAVLAAGAVQHDERGLRRLGAQPLHETGAHADRHPLTPQRLGPPRPPPRRGRPNRPLPLQGATALENSNPSHYPAFRRGIRTTCPPEESLCGLWTVDCGPASADGGRRTADGVPVSVPYKATSSSST